MVKLSINNCCLLITFLLISWQCHPSQSSWNPESLPPIALPPVVYPVDQELLADMVTAAMRSLPTASFSGKAKSTEFRDIPQDPQSGPFFFQWGDALVAVADTETHLREAIFRSKLVAERPEISFLQLLGTPYWDEVKLSRQVRRLSLESTTMPYRAAANRKIKLTPANMANALAQFAEWEGVHLDTLNQTLTFFGSNDRDNPQLSASDLTAAYQAIFEHEANGEAIFVDMDFAEGMEHYLVTFGGGLEDTRPGRVLYNADLLLKALSSGIDPWANEKPLVASLCGSSRKSPFQRVFCDYVNPFVHRNRKQINLTIDEFVGLIKNGLEDAETIFRFVKLGQTTEKEAWNYIFEADTHQQKIIESQIESDSSFYFAGARWGVKKDSIFDQAATKRSVKKIFHLQEKEKNLIRQAIKISNRKERELFVLLTLPSSEIQNLLKVDHPYFPQLISLIDKQFGNSLAYFIAKNKDNANIKENIDEEKDREQDLRSALTTLYFMARDSNFTKDFLKLPKEDQYLIFKITIEMIANRGFLNMIDNLQYTQPLCQSAKLSDNIFTKFVCDHLSEYKRTYLADLIKEEVGAYKPAHELDVKSKPPKEEEDYKKIRYWFYPGKEVLTLKDTSDLRTFLFKDPTMEARSELLESRRGPHERVTDSTEIPGIQENLKIVNQHYNALSEVFPTLKELSNLVRMLAFFRWVRNYQADRFDLEAFENYVDYGTPTERHYPIIETVMALQNGRTLRSVGGVDLHSRTQVGFDPEKIRRLQEGLQLASGRHAFQVDGKRYITAPPIRAVTASRRKPSQTLSRGEQEITLSGAGGLQTTKLAEAGQLQWSLANQLTFSREKEVVFSTYGPEVTKRIVWQPTSGIQQSWEIKINEDVVIARRQPLLQQMGGDDSFLAEMRTGFEELCNQNVPFEAIWSYLSALFEDVKLVEQNDGFLGSFRLNGSLQHWLAKPDEDGRFSVSTVGSSEARAFAEAAPILRTTNKQLRLMAIELKSKVPTDSLIIDDLGYRNDTLLEVEVWSPELNRMSIFDWRLVTGASRDQEQLVLDDEQKSFIMGPAKTEAQKGNMASYRLTNRAFIIELIADLRATYAGTGNHFGYVSSFSYAGADKDKIFPNRGFQYRHFVIDTAGFAPAMRDRLLRLGDQFASVISFFERGKVHLPDRPISELIWITTLTEREIRARLKATSSSGQLAGVERLRIFNTNNPVFDLGEQLFINCPNLLTLGAWTHIVDFDPLMVLVERLLTHQQYELDRQVFELVREIQSEFRQSPTPLKLRIARDLEEVYYSWEEVRSGRNYKGSNWTISEN